MKLEEVGDEYRNRGNMDSSSLQGSMLQAQAYSGTSILGSSGTRNSVHSVEFDPVSQKMTLPYKQPKIRFQEEGTLQCTAVRSDVSAR
jgi:hypothetical protein